PAGSRPSRRPGRAPCCPPPAPVPGSPCPWTTPCSDGLNAAEREVRGRNDGVDGPVGHDGNDEASPPLIHPRQQDAEDEDGQEMNRVQVNGRKERGADKEGPASQVGPQ